MAQFGTLQPRMPENRAKAARIVISKHTVFERQIDMIMSARRPRLRQEPQAPRHAQMHDQRAMGQSHQQILAAPIDRFDKLPSQQVVQPWRHRPAQLRLPHESAEQSAADDTLMQASPHNFDFREFRHGCLVAVTEPQRGTDGLWQSTLNSKFARCADVEAV